MYRLYNITIHIYYLHKRHFICRFVNFMVKDFNIAKSEEEVGYYSGYLASSFFLGQFVSRFVSFLKYKKKLLTSPSHYIFSYFWGYLSDKYGRRPILLIGVFGSMVSVTMFGFSQSYFWAIFIRSVGGFLNSILINPCILKRKHERTKMNKTKKKKKRAKKNN